MTNRTACVGRYGSRSGAIAAFPKANGLDNHPNCTTNVNKKLPVPFRIPII